MGLSVLPGLLPRLRAAAGQGESGWLTGVITPEGTVVLGSILQGSEQDGLPGYPASLLPHGIVVVGAFVSQQSKSLEDAKADLVSHATRAEGGEFIGAVLEDAGYGFSFMQIIGSACTPVQAAEPSAEAGACSWLEQHFSFVRCHAAVDVLVYGLRTVEDASGGEASRATVPLLSASQAAFDAVAESLAGSDSVYVASEAAPGTGQRMLDPAAGNSCGDLGGTLAQPLHVACFCRRGSTENRAPVLEYQPVQGGPISLDTAPAYVDVLCLAPKSMPASALPERVLRPALRAQLAAMRQATIARGAACRLRALHFLPPGWPHPLTLVYPLGLGGGGKSLEAAEERLLPLRQALHRRLGLPMDRPLLRCANALSFAIEAAQQSAAGPSGGAKGRLRDVHVGLPPSGVQGGVLHMVDGSYEYCHYMQEKFDDAGWGCAYRSLQTIWSWFGAQHYTSAPVPSHRQIQQALVDLGDKPRAFVGSRQWVGAIELGFVLDSLLGITCRVITVPSGADMPSRAREIAHHFDTQGTPIMIGGGVLAYTLLGIDHNELTGACSFLILDPHYTGGDDLKAIHKGQWVAWKSADGRAAAGGDLFVKDAFYNLLCPQRPRMV